MFVERNTQFNGCCCCWLRDNVMLELRSAGDHSVNIKGHLASSVVYIVQTGFIIFEIYCFLSVTLCFSFLSITLAFISRAATVNTEVMASVVFGGYVGFPSIFTVYNLKAIILKANSSSCF